MKIKKSANYRSIHLLHMFWKIVVLKTDKISSLKITYKKDARMVSFACAFRTVARLKILVGWKVLIFNKDDPKL